MFTLRLETRLISKNSAAYDCQERFDSIALTADPMCYVVTNQTRSFRLSVTLYAFPEPVCLTQTHLSPARNNGVPS
jgi:hypothetical protein